MVELEDIRVSMAEILSIPLNELHGDTVLDVSGNWDSLAIIGTVALIFEKTGETVSNEEIGDAVTLQDILDLAIRKVSKSA